MTGSVHVVVEIMHGEIQGVIGVWSTHEQAIRQQDEFTAKRAGHEGRWTAYIEEWTIDGDRQDSDASL